MATTDDLEKQAEINRTQLAATLDELRTRMSPGELVDQAWSFARGHGGGEFIRNLGGQVRTNPIPVALIVAGLGWLMTGRPPTAARGYAPSIVPDEDPYLGEGYGDAARDASAQAAGALRDSAHRTSDRARGAMASAREKADEALARARDGAASAREDVEGAMSSARDTLSSAYDAAAGAVGRTASATASAVSDTTSAIGRRAHDVRDFASEVGRSTAERARHAGESVARQAGRAQSAATQIIREQPLIVGAVGLALGAIIGAMLPRSRREDELMGEASDHVKQSATGAAREQLQHAREAGERIVEKVQSEAEHQGLSPDAAKELVHDIGGKVSAVATAARESAEGELKSAKDAVKDKAQGDGEPRESVDERPQTPASTHASGNVHEAAGAERYSEADPNYLPEGSGQPSNEDIKATERVG